MARPTDPEPRGVVYALPKTLLKVTVPYTIREQKLVIHGRNVESKNAPEVMVLEPVKVEAVSVADDNNRLLISGEELSESWILESNLGFTVDENGLLAGVDADTKDKTFEAAQALVTTGINVAKLLAAAGPGRPPEELEGILKRIEEIYGEVARAKAEGKSTRLDKLQSLQKELSVLLELVETYEKTNQTTATTSKVEFVAYVDPATCPKAQGAGVSCEVRADGLGMNIPKASIPKVTVLVDVPHDVVDKAGAKVLADDKPRRGIAYRVARPVTVKVVVAFGGASFEVGRGQLAIAQFGTMAFADMASKKFGSQKIAATFDATGIRTYKVESSSVADKGLEAAASSIENAQKAITAVRDLEIERLKKEKERLDAKAALAPAPDKTEDEKRLEELKRQTELIKAEADLEAAKAELEKARRGEPGD